MSYARPLISLPFESDDALVAFFHDIGPSAMLRIDELHPGLSSMSYSAIGEESIYEIFAECCKEEGYEICLDVDSQKPVLSKMPLSVFYANKIHSAALSFASSSSVAEKDMYLITESGKSQFGVIAQNILSRSGAAASSSGLGSMSWVLKDGSSIDMVNQSSLKVYFGKYSNDQINLSEFDSAFKAKLVKSISAESEMSVF